MTTGMETQPAFPAAGTRIGVLNELLRAVGLDPSEFGGGVDGVRHRHLPLVIVEFDNADPDDMSKAYQAYLPEKANATSLEWLCRILVDRARAMPDVLGFLLEKPVVAMWDELNKQGTQFQQFATTFANQRSVAFTILGELLGVDQDYLMRMMGNVIPQNELRKAIEQMKEQPNFYGEFPTSFLKGYEAAVGEYQRNTAPRPEGN